MGKKAVKCWTVLWVLLAAAILVSGCRKDDDLNDNHQSQNENNSGESPNDNNSGGSQNGNNPNIPQEKTWDLIYELTNNRDENVYFYADDKAISVVEPYMKSSGILKISGVSYVTVTVKNAAGLKICTKTVREGGAFVEIVYNECYYKNKNTLKILNQSGDTYAVYINDNLVVTLNSGYYKEVELDASQTYKLYALQKDGYFFYPTELNATHKADACEYKTWTIK